MREASTFGDVGQETRDLTPDQRRVLTALTQMPLLWTDAICDLAGLGSISTAYRVMSALEERGLVGTFRPRGRGSASPHLYHLTDLGVAVAAGMQRLDPVQMATRYRLRGEDLVARLEGLKPLTALYELAAALVPPRQRLVRWSAPWTGRYFRLTANALRRVSLPAYLEVSTDAGRPAPYLLLPDDGRRELAGYRPSLAALAEYAAFRGGDLPLLIVATTSLPSALEWERLLDDPAGDGRTRPLPGYVFSWDELHDGRARLVPPCLVVRSHAQPLSVRSAAPQPPYRRVPETVSRGLRKIPFHDLSPDDYDLLELVGKHPFLSTADIACVLDWSPEKAARTRRKLLRNGLLREPGEGELGGSADKGLTELTTQGLRPVAAGVKLRPDRAVSLLGLSGGGPTEPFGSRRALARDSKHTLGVNSLFVGLYRVAAEWRRAGYDYYATNWTGAPVSGRREVRPDGRAAFWLGEHRYEFALEYDRNTESEAELVWKFDRYRRLYEQEKGCVTLSVLVVTTDARREESIAQAVLSASAGQRTQLPVLITTEDRVKAERDGMLAPVWRDAVGPVRRHWLKLGRSAPLPGYG